jgi:hypothetical protein
MSLATFNRSKTMFVLLVASLTFIAANLRADDSVVQSSDDLSAADKVAAEHLQKQIDDENKAAHDKAERDWQNEHSSGGDITVLIVPAFFVLVIGGAIIYCKILGSNWYFNWQSKPPKHKTVKKKSHNETVAKIVAENRADFQKPDIFHKCACPHCGQSIEYPADGMGQTVPCPTCEKSFMLLSDVVIPSAKRRLKKWDKWDATQSEKTT